MTTQRLRTPLPKTGTLPRSGRIRLGEPKKSASIPGRPLPYFTVYEDASGITSAAAAEAFHREYGEQPTSIRAYLPAPNPEDVFEGAWRVWGQSGIKRECTGPVAEGGTGECRVRDKDGEFVKAECKCGALPAKSKERCKFAWELKLLLPNVSFGVWDVVSGSFVGWQNVLGSLDLIHKLSGGNFNLIEGDVVLQPINGKGGGKVYVVSVQATASALELMRGKGRFDMQAEIATQDKAALDAQPRYQLPASSLDDEPDELLHEGEVIDQDEVLVVPHETTDSATPAPRNDAGVAPHVLLGASLERMTDDDKAELKERIPVPTGMRLSGLASLLGDEWVTELDALLALLRHHDCSFADLAAHLNGVPETAEDFAREIALDTLTDAPVEPISGQVPIGGVR